MFFTISLQKLETYELLDLAQKVKVELQRRAEFQRQRDARNYEPLTDEEKATALVGNKISAIKNYRDRVRCDLRMAKDAVEDYLLDHALGKV
jgi:ribosomal protein L7/L12